jgi:ribosomal protein L37AE/L43A
MTDKFSSSHWAQIVKRVTRAEFKFDTKWLCFLCGKRFTHAACQHSIEENKALAERVRTSLV